MGIMVSAAFAGDQPRNEILLVIPWVTLAFGWSFVLNDVKVFRLSQYFGTHNTSDDDLTWESWRRQQGQSWLERPLTGALVQALVFIIPGSVSPLVYLSLRESTPLAKWEVASIAVGGALTITLAWAVASAGRLRSAKR